jgi:hypothetical protein
MEPDFTKLNISWSETIRSVGAPLPEEVSMTKFHNRLIRVDLAENGSFIYTENKGDAKERHSHRHHGEVFQWTSEVGSLEITFPGGHPFDEHPVPAEAGQRTAPVRVRREAELRSYKYDVILTEKNGVEHRDDPLIVIHENDGFADPGMDDGFADPGMDDD